MSNLRHRIRGRGAAARRAHALQRAMRSVDSRAVREEVLSLLGH
jgi:hypothetical protein